MPIYEYACKSCEKTFEYQQRISDDPKTECESCGGALERLISATAFHLKGGGWYKDLYSSTPKDGGKAGGDGASSGDSSTKSSDSSAGSDSKTSSTSTSGEASGSTTTKSKD